MQEEERYVGLEDFDIPERMRVDGVRRKVGDETAARRQRKIYFRAGPGWLGTSHSTKIKACGSADENGSAVIGRLSGCSFGQ